MSKKTNISQLGRDFKETKSEKLFKQLFDLCKPGVINYYQKYGNSVESIEDAYNESMISIWTDIDKLDVEKYSISTMIYLKTRQKLIRTIDKENSNNTFSMDSNNLTNKIHNEAPETISDLQEEYIEDENIDTFWGNVRDILDDDISYNILYDTFVEKLSGKDIAEKYTVNTQTVANRIFQAKKKISKNSDIYGEYID